jgi:hypothetical protein
MIVRMQSRLLAVCLDPSTEEIARRTLSDAGADTDVAQSADEAYAHLLRRRYGVIIADRTVIDELTPALGVILPHPVVIVVGGDRESLNPDVVTLVVPRAYDPQTLVGVVLACLNATRFPLADGRREGIEEVC